MSTTRLSIACAVAQLLSFDFGAANAVVGERFSVQSVYNQQLEVKSKQWIHNNSNHEKMVRLSLSHSSASASLPCFLNHHPNANSFRLNGAFISGLDYNPATCCMNGIFFALRQWLAALCVSRPNSQREGISPVSPAAGRDNPVKKNDTTGSCSEALIPAFSAVAGQEHMFTDPVCRNMRGW